MSGRFGPKYRTIPESTFSSSPSRGSQFSQDENRFEVHSADEQWKVKEGRKNRRSKAKNFAEPNFSPTDRNKSGGQSRKRSNSKEDARRTKNRSQSYGDSKRFDEHPDKERGSNCSYIPVDHEQRPSRLDKQTFKRDSTMTYTKLQKISVKDSTDIIRILANSQSGLEEFLSGNIKPDHMYLIVKIIRKLIASDWEANKAHVLLKVSTPEFFKKITQFVTFLVTDAQTNKSHEEMEEFFENLLKFFEAVIITLPSVAADHLKGPMIATSMALGNVTQYQNVVIKPSINDKLKLLLSDLSERKTEKGEREKVIPGKQVELVYPKPLGSIHNIPLYPTSQDIDMVEGSLMPNKIEGPYNNVEHYLDIHFRLFREDFIAPLRRGIKEYRIGHCEKKNRARPKFSHIRIYKNVKFLRPTVIMDKVGYDICIDQEKKLTVKWDTTKRFIFGSLLVFTLDNFKTFFLATVANRNLELLDKYRVVSVVICDTKEVSKDLTSKEFTMAESEVYFEPYYNVLKALKRLDYLTFPLKKYIVYLDKKSEPPAYTRNGSDVYSIMVGEKGINGRRTFRIFEDQTWPSCNELGFDKSQHQAFKAALTSELVVIQGPPGTGKTFLGLKIAGALLENSVIWNFNHTTPILVICYTNHALDQFLEGILEHGLTNNLIRIGGRSKSECLEPFNLKERRRSAAYFCPNYDQAALLKDLKREMSNIFWSIKVLQDNLDHFDKAIGVMSLKTLRIVMNEHHKGFFQNNDDLISWLLFGVRLRSKNKLISTSDKGISKQTEDLDEFEFDESDIENVTRLKEILFDSMELDKSDEPSNLEFVEQIKIYYSFTLEEIKKKIDKLDGELNVTPNPEETIDTIRTQMREAKKAHSDLTLIYNYFDQHLKNTKIPTQDETNKVYKCGDLNTLHLCDRWTLYKSWVEFVKAGNWLCLQALEERYRKGGERFQETRQYDDLKIVQQADVVGVTTTTASKLQAMLKELKPKIVIVEEAAEAMEAHIVASLSVHCQHLILIGDHKQLRPSPADYQIGTHHHLDISLFERLVMNGINYYTLTTQHRMRPEISHLLVPTIYPVLQNHDSTKNRGRILGIDHNIFFMNHNNFEEEVVDILSKRNIFEARMAMGLARHLLLQGYSPDEITVLTTYNAQMHVLKDEQKRLDLPKDLMVTVVDNFQGEESRIIILSLVRSNTANKIGFLKTENRVCVALSRARDGLFIFGNMDCLTAESQLWQRIRKSLIEQNSFGPSLVLRCENHRNKLTSITSDRDFAQVLEGGCNERCGEQLPCGHTCHSLCHVSKDRHLRYRCSQPCNRQICNDGHVCTKKCYEDCGKCTRPMERLLACGHQITMPCCVDYRKLQCQVLVTLDFNECGHKVKVQCFRRTTKHCPEPCIWRLECGHQCTRPCHINDDPDHLKYVCMKRCIKPPARCATEGHQCPLACFEECEPCVADVVKTLACGHTVTVPCVESTSILCTVPCSRTLLCKHPCKMKCHEECGNCKFKVEKVVPLCGHTVKVACSVKPTKSLCDGACGVRLACGHKCSQLCRDVCSSAKCEVTIPLNIALPCGHSGAMIPCNLIDSVTSGNIDSLEQERLLQFCGEPCLQTLECEHRCSGTCGACMQGRIHKVCDEDCNNPLICGHSCPVPCRQICPPCQKPCPVSCVHTKCNKKCGEPCIPCNEPCEYQCVHSKCKKRCGELCVRKPCTFPCLIPLACSHPCVGFCGEPCPPCKECHPEHYEPIFYTGEEEDPETRWVLLNDCKHVVDAPNLERWLQQGVDNKGSEIKLKTCPKCTPTAANRYIATTQRYMNLVKTTFLDIQQVKKKIYGELEEIRKIRKKLLRDVENIEITNIVEIAAADELNFLHSHLTRNLPYKFKERRKEIGQERLRVLEFMVKYLTEMVNHVKEVDSKLNDQTKFKCTAKISALTKALKIRDQKISTQEIQSFLMEQKRIVRFTDILILESTREFQELKTNSKVMVSFRKAETLVNQLTRYTDEHDKKVFEAIQELKTILKSSVHLSKADMKMIHEVMSKQFFGGSGAKGHWFKCPNGHPYVITECGGAVVESNCPENGCGARIGGRNHRYLPDQQLFSEMDGAERPAWSSHFDMRNFNLND